MRKLNVSLLSRDEVDRAYPLIQAVMPEASIEAWRRFAGARLSNAASTTTGILSVHNEQSCIVGLGAYRLAEDLLHGPVLFADQFCALDIMDPTSIARALMRAIERVAEQQGCSAIHTTLASANAESSDGWISNVLHERGHCVKGLQMCKLIATADQPGH